MHESRPAPRIVLLGMMGSGKSTVGRELAKRTGWRYVDNDDLVRSVSGREPHEIDATSGEEVLHAAEAAALHHAMSMDPPLIVGAAAWVVLDPASVVLLREQPNVIYLSARPETLRERVGAGHGRRDDARDLAWLRRRSAERDETYRELAWLTIDTDELLPDQVAARILEAIEADAPGRATSAQT